jgi:hypothetical protein
VWPNGTTANQFDLLVAIKTNTDINRRQRIGDRLVPTFGSSQNGVAETGREFRKVGPGLGHYVGCFRLWYTLFASVAKKLQQKLHCSNYPALRDAIVTGNILSKLCSISSRLQQIM